MNFVTNCIHTDKTNLQTMYRRIEKGIIQTVTWPLAEVYACPNPDFIPSSRDNGPLAYTLGYNAVTTRPGQVVFPLELDL